jgi:phospholipid transport system substrate-binding protein
MNRRYRVKKTIIVVLALGLLVPAAAFGLQPMEALRGPIEEGVGLLSDPMYAGPAKKDEQRHRIWEIIRQSFDFRLISARALGRNWRKFSPDQKVEFTDVFTALLGNTYIGKIQGEFKDEKVVFLEQDMVSDNKAVVKTRIVRKNAEIAVDYNMVLRNGQWRVYDVKVEGIGLVLNYRKQFKAFMAKKNGSPVTLIDALKEKLDE